ncbi:DUF642 domain-containing protein [Alkalimonas collagenimarina]|uniref:DUF642 domain-containing protein n=1 Tax=Alkalimonas collagenimarina TaxID=400390 RepID=A0ABT9H145_9GAMM|nr:DUF642 domain-containing protein [Alkalimonas collagenimarina]MDP4537042.1 DUF642 domain-containing protein [Alkalimonas collagenimarina]
MSFALVRTVVGAAVLAVASFSSQASLIVNGDFELNTVNPNSWTWLASSQVAGWQGSNIEIWNSMNGVQAASGNNFIELNAHGSNQGAWSIFQSFATDIGQSYELSFFYRARNGSNEQFNVTVANLSQTLNDHTNQGWSFFNSSFVATDSNTTLRFTSHNSGTIGNFLDGVSVVSRQGVAAVPAPATLGVMALGLVLLGAARRMRSR